MQDDTILQNLMEDIAGAQILTDQQLYDRFFYNVACRELIAYNIFRQLHTILTDGDSVSIFGSKIDVTLQTSFAVPNRELLWKDNTFLDRYKHSIQANMLRDTQWEATQTALQITCTQLPGTELDFTEAEVSLFTLLQTMLDEYKTTLIGIVPGLYIKVRQNTVEHSPDFGAFTCTLIFKHFDSTHPGTLEEVFIDPTIHVEEAEILALAFQAIIIQVGSADLLAGPAYLKIAEEVGFNLSEVPPAFGVEGITTYTLTFNAGAGEGMMPNQTFTKGEYQPLNSCIFVNPSYTFSHWIDEDGGTYSDRESIKLSKDLTLIAQWKLVDAGEDGNISVNIYSNDLPPSYSVGSVIQFTITTKQSGGVYPYTYTLLQDGIYKTDNVTGIFEVKDVSENCVFTVRVTDSNNISASADLHIRFSYPMYYKFEEIGDDPEEVNTAPSTTDLATFTGVESAKDGGSIELTYYGDDITNYRLVLLYDKDWGSIKRIEHTDISSNNSQTSASGDIGVTALDDKTLIQLPGEHYTLLYYKNPVQIESTGSKYTITF